MGPMQTNQEGAAQPFLGGRVSRGRTLLIDEDPDALHHYCSVLKAWGYEVRACRCYEEGMSYLGSEVFDFVIVSQGGHDFEGRCVLERAMEINRRLPVLVVARCLDITCYLEAMQLGAVDYLTEPVAVSEMERVFKNHRPTVNHAA